MKKTKILIPALSIASVGAVVAPIATLSSCTKTTEQILTYDQAKEWIKTNYGETSTFVAPTKVVSSWDFSGEITNRKTMTEYASYKTYIKNHLASCFDQLGKMGYTTAATTITTETEEKNLTYSAKTTEDFKIDNPSFTEQNFMAPLCSENFDTLLDTYFYSTEAKKVVSFVANGKTLKVSGTLSSLTEVTTAGASGLNIFSMPDCTITFENGKLVSTEFSFKKYAEAEYIWISYEKVNYSDYFRFTINEGGKVSYKYTYTAE